MAKQHNSAQNNAAIKRKAAKLEQSLSAARGEGLSLEELKTETDFAKYLIMLKGFAQRYCVMVVAYNTPWGPNFSHELTQLMMNIGFSEDLYGKFRCAYAAIIKTGNLIFEKLEEDTKKIVKYKLPDMDVNLVSIGFNAYQMNNYAKIEINGKICSQPLRRGLHFVVYDQVTEIVIDSVNFDVYANDIFAYRQNDENNYELEKIKSFAEKHPGVSIIPFISPQFPDDNLSQGEQYLVENNIFYAHTQMTQCINLPYFPLKKYYNNEGIAEVLSAPKSFFSIDGVRRFDDIAGKYLNTMGGHRVTSYQPPISDNNIYMCGGCTVFGIGSDDSNTIASHLQKILNTMLPDSKIIVQNYGFFLAEGDRKNHEEITILESLHVKPGDIVLCDFGYNPEKFFIDTSDIVNGPRTCDIFYDSSHYTPDGNRLIAEKLFEGLMEQGILERAQKLVNVPAVGGGEQSNPNFDHDTNAQLAEYKRFLTDFYNSTLKQTIGAIVMNCNPFTLGHRYLIDKALEQCSFLIVFLVEEDRSVFPFEDRLKLVDEGTKDIPNLAIIPSGRFVLSSLTFSEYFNKSELQDRIIDTSLDVSVFAREIAPCLHITKRFAGEEPFDNVTRQYNETMRKVLPEYGIDFVEIPRCEISGAAISASRVRALLENRDFDGIKPIVPDSTFEYLMSKYSK